MISNRPKAMSQVTYKLPDFTGPDGTRYTEIEVIIQSQDGEREAAKLAGTVGKALEQGRSNDQEN